MPDPESNSKSARQHFRFRRAAWIVVALIMLALIVWQGFGFLSFRSTHVTTSDARIEANVISVASRSAGWITHFDLISADPVHKGEVLAFIYRRPAAESLAELRAQRSVLEAQIDASRAQLAETRGTTAAAVQATKAEVDAAEASLKGLRASSTLAVNDEARGRGELKQASISKQAYEKLETAAEVAHEKVRAGQAGVASAKAAYAKAVAGTDQVAVLASRIKQYQAQVTALDRKIDAAKTDLDDLSLRSPIDGVVDKTFVHQGDYVSSGETLLMIHDPAHIWVTAKVKETALARIRVGDPVQISVDAYPGRVFHGSVQRVGTAATNQFALLPSPNPSGNFVKVVQRVPVRIAVKQVKGDLLKPGLNLEVAIRIDGRQ
jgi:membrane fusion protein, multidrug efflux system